MQDLPTWTAWSLCQDLTLLQGCGKGLVKKHYKNQLNSTENTRHQRVHSKVPYNVIPLVGWCAVVLPGSRSRWGGQSPAAFLW